MDNIDYKVSGFKRINGPGGENLPSLFIRTLFLSLIIFISLSAINSPGALAQDEGLDFFIRVSGGYSAPELENLSGELTSQGSDELGDGYGISLSLGSSLMGSAWMAEATFSASFYESFFYQNEYEDFEGNLSHQRYGLIIWRDLMPGSSRFTPFAGAGLGYGTTKLISGGGKLGSFQWEALGGMQIRVKGNFSLLMEANYRSSFTGDTYDSPYLKNVEGDAVYDSGGSPLKDRYSSLELRIGLVIRRHETESN